MLCGWCEVGKKYRKLTLRRTNISKNRKQSTHPISLSFYMHLDFSMVHGFSPSERILRMHLSPHGNFPFWWRVIRLRTNASTRLSAKLRSHCLMRGCAVRACSPTNSGARGRRRAQLSRGAHAPPPRPEGRQQLEVHRTSRRAGPTRALPREQGKATTTPAQCRLASWRKRYHLSERWSVSRPI